jgi:hypothetical protein
MNWVARKRLIDTALMLIESDTLPAVPMDEFFSGNTDDSSFGRHMQTSRDIPIAEYAEVFRSIQARPDVQGVYVKVHEVPDDADSSEREMWPSAFVVFILTSAPEATVENWLRQIEPRYANGTWQPLPDLKVPWREPLAPGIRPVLVEML